MTRINADICPRILLDQHLMAEYRELPMVYASLQRTIASSIKRFNIINIEFITSKIQPDFCLNSGHVCFFYDKLLFLNNRYHRLIAELKLRGYNIDDERQFSIVHFPKELKNDWVMDANAKRIIVQRLVEKYDMKPTWYKYYGATITRECFLTMMEGSV